MEVRERERERSPVQPHPSSFPLTMSQTSGYSGYYYSTHHLWKQCSNTFFVMMLGTRSHHYSLSLRTRMHEKVSSNKTLESLVVKKDLLKKTSAKHRPHLT